MARRSRSDSGRQAIIWLATAFVIVIGAAASAFVIFAGAEQRHKPFLVWGLAFAGLVVFLILVSIRWEDHASRLKIWLLAKDRTDPTDVYRAARRKTNAREQFGDNAPPSIETLRDAADHGGAWVPKGTAVPRQQHK